MVRTWNSILCFVLIVATNFYTKPSHAAQSDGTFVWKLNPGEVCLRLASPGDILMGRDFGSMHYGPVTPAAAAFDVATLTPFTFKNPHTGAVLNVHPATAADVRA